MENWQINASEWPPQSPNLNIIENVWWMMKLAQSQQEQNSSKDMLKISNL